MDFYGQQAYDEESEAMNGHIMKLVVATELMVELKPMIFAREQAQSNTYEQLLSPSLKETFNNIMQSIQQLWDEAATMPSYGKIVERYEFSDDFSSVADEDEETEDEEEEAEEKVTFSSHPKQEDVATFPLKGEEVEKEETEEKAKEAEDVPFETPLLYKELKPYVPPVTFSSHPKKEDVATFPLKGEEVEKEEMEEKSKEAEDVPFEAPLLYKELKPYVPPIIFLSRLHKSKWNKWFSELISPHFIVNIYLPLLIVGRNMSARETFFKDLIAYRRKFETLEFG